MTPYPLYRSDRNTKVLITLFLGTMLVSIGVAELNVYDKVRWTPAGIVARYGPDPDVPPPNVTETPAPGPTDDFPLETGSNAADSPSAIQEPNGGVVPTETLVARMNTFTLLLDVTHPHVFELPVVLFVLAHFLMRTRVPDWLKLTVYVLTFGGVAAFLGTPWLVRYVSPAAAPLLLVGAIAVGLTSLTMILVSVFDMWLPRRASAQPSEAK